MKTCVSILFAFTLLTVTDGLLAQGTAFTYQGQLSSNGVPLNGNYDFQFSLYPNAAGTGSPLGPSPITQTAIGVTNGLFTVPLDFGAVFSGNDTWLAISVRSNNVGSYTALTPLQELTPTPYAIYTPNAGNAATATSAISAATANNVAIGITITNAVITNSVFVGNGGGLTNVPGTLTQTVISGSTLTAQPNTAYNLSNSTTVGITLPACANVGDIIQVTAPAGSGGWQVAADNYFDWTPQTNGFPPVPGN